MDNFFDDLKNNLEQRPEPEFEESAWLSMKEKLQPNKNQRKAIGWWWLSWLILPLIMSNGWMYLQLKNANQLAEDSQNSIVEIRRDTIFTSQTIYIRDTVYKNNSTIIYKNNPTENFQIAQNLSSYFSTSKNSFFKKNIFNNSPNNEVSFQNHNYFSLLNNPYLSSRSNSSNPNNPDLIESINNSDIKKNKILNTLNINPLAIELINKNNFLPLELDLEEVSIFNKNKKRKRWGQITNAMRPKSFSLGIGGGYLYPTNENISNKEGYDLAIQGSISFSKKLRMWFEASYLRLHLEEVNLNNKFGIPNIPLPNDDYTFEKASTDYPLLQYGVGMKYLFNTKKRIRPFIGIGFGVANVQPYEVEYEYLDLAGNEVIIPRDFSSQGKQSNQWIINSGLEYQFGKRWLGQIEGFYRANWETENYNTPNILGLKTRLIYIFGSK